MKVLVFVLLFSSSCFAGWGTEQTSHDSTGKIVGKVAITAAVSTFTGGVLLAAQRVCKWSEVLDSPYSFLAVAAALLYAQAKIVEETIGEEYRNASLYSSIVMMLGMAGVLIYQGAH